jgi:hypothetical protein
VPRHWSQKRKYLQGKRGIEKPPFELPDFIAATGISELRQTYLDKEADKKLKAKQRDRMAPKMGKMDIDYAILHDAFFVHQRPPPLTAMGELYYEGKEYEAKLSNVRPGVLSDALREALGMGEGAPPPWLINMQRYGPPPSYPSLKVPGGRRAAAAADDDAAQLSACVFGGGGLLSPGRRCSRQAGRALLARLAGAHEPALPACSTSPAPAPPRHGQRAAQRLTPPPGPLQASTHPSRPTPSSATTPADGASRRWTRMATRCTATSSARWAAWPGALCMPPGQAGRQAGRQASAGPGPDHRGHTATPPLSPLTGAPARPPARRRWTCTTATRTCHGA